MTAAGTWGLKFLSIMPVLIGPVRGLVGERWVDRLGGFWLYDFASVLTLAEADVGLGGCRA